jgi:hypothetical protein
MMVPAPVYVRVRLRAICQHPLDVGGAQIVVIKVWESSPAQNGSMTGYISSRQ